MTLFFLHGRFGHGGVWQPLVETLAAGSRCVWIDLPGFGSSFSVRERGLSLLEHAELAHQVMDRFLESDRGAYSGASRSAVLIGHDFGAAVSQLVALRDPQKVAGLVLVNASCLTQPSGLNPGWLGLAARHRLNLLLKNASCESMSRVLKEPWNHRESRHELVRSIRALDTSWPAFYERAFWQKEISKIECPALILWGSRDTLNPPQRALELMQSLRESYLFQQDRCGHWPNLEDPAWAALKIREFVFRLGSFTRARKSLSR